VAHWLLDEGVGTSVADASGNGNSATLVNGATWAIGQLGNAIDFDGIDDAVNAGSPADLDDLQSFTYAAWINPDSDGDGANGVIVSKGGTGASASRRFLVNRGSSCPEGYCLELHVNRAATDASVFSSPGLIETNVWQHVTATFSPTDGPRIYKDGVEVDYTSGRSVGSGTLEDDSTSDLVIGSWPGGFGSFDGRQDDVRVYDSALVPSAVAALFELVQGT
jgi:hypothetical protein